MVSNSSTTTDTKGAANAVGGKTARACDSCIKKRARWYCAADDAFLCQSCDSSVHSANPLARRHERVRLKTASFKSLSTKGNKDNVPSWPQRKARTPRPHGKPYDKKQQLVRSSTSGLRVPEAGSDDQASNEEETEQHLLYRVPIYDPFVAELCNNSGNINSFDEDNNINKCRVWSSEREGKDHGQEGLFPLYGKDGEESFRDFLASEMELADFTADVESLLGRGVEEESTFGMEELGLVSGCSAKEENSEALGFRQDIGNGVVKEEQMMTLELGFDYDDEELSPDLCRGGGDEAEWKMKGEVGVDKKRREVLLRLDYDAVMSAWGSKGGCPWTTGCRPHYDPDQSWPDCLGTWGTELQHPYGEHINGLRGGGHPAILEDGGREARVSRYREKRRTRLFSKKIRYEVRKLNAEKRPRMKGRFVKRVTSSGTSFPLLKK